MKIRGILNNNAVVVRLSDGKEAIIVSKGIGFSHRAGDDIAVTDSQKVFVLKNDEASRHFKDLAVEVPIEIFEVCQDIFRTLNEQTGRYTGQELVHHAY